MENRIKIYDIVLTVLLVIAACFGVGFSVANRVDKGSGEITVENYGNFLSVTCSCSNGWGASAYSMQYDYSVRFVSDSKYRLKDLTVQYALKSEYSDINGTYTRTIEELDGEEAYKGKVNYEFPQELSITEVMSIFPEIELTVISVSGTYEYTGGAQ